MFECPFITSSSCRYCGEFRSGPGNLLEWLEIGDELDSGEGGCVLDVVGACDYADTAPGPMGDEFGGGV